MYTTIEVNRHVILKGLDWAKCETNLLEVMIKMLAISVSEWQRSPERQRITEL